MSGAADMTSAMVTMIAALAAVLGVICILFYAVRRFSHVPGSPAGHRLVSVLGSTFLGVKKTISLVEVPGAVLVLGITADRISLLTTIDDPAAIEALHHRSDASSGRSFLNQLQQVVGKK